MLEITVIMILAVILYFISEEVENTYITMYLTVIVTTIAMLIIFCSSINEQQNYITELETKINIYDESYINYAIEDSMMQ